MAFATWWRGDPCPALAPLPTLFADPTEDVVLLAQMAHLEQKEVRRRLDQGHRPYIAWLDGQPTAYGWVATQTAEIGELDLIINLSRSQRYLWDFATLPEWRGRGIYPRLLQAILAAESAEAEHFWIIAAPENRASSAGIAKAGFISIAHLSFQRAGQLGLVAIEPGDRVSAASMLLQVPVLQAEPQAALSPCWHCAIDARQDSQTPVDVACWPASSSAAFVVPTCQCARDRSVFCKRSYQP